MLSTATDAATTRSKFLPRNLHEEIRLLRGMLQLSKGRKPVDDDEAGWFLRLIDLYSHTEMWEQVVDCASSVVLRGCEMRFEPGFYRAWIEGLAGCHDLRGLRMLARHLGKKRHEGEVYGGLELLARTWGGELRRARRLATEYDHRAVSDLFIAEALGIFFCEDLTQGRMREGLKLLHNVARRRRAAHSARRSLLTYALDFNAWKLACEALRLMSDYAPEAPEPYWVTTAISLLDGDWTAARNAMVVMHSLNPRCTDAILYLARCEELLGRGIAARDLLVRNRELFAGDDYEYNVSLGMIERGIWRRGGGDDWCSHALAHLTAAMRSASVYGFPVAPLQALIAEMSHENQPSVSRSGFWLLATGEDHVHAMIEGDTCFLGCPAGMTRGDIVFVSTMSAGELAERQSVAFGGFLEVLSEPVPDPKFGMVARLGQWSSFEGPVEIQWGVPPAPARDRFGCENFARHGQLHYFSLTESPIDLGSVLAQVKHVLESRCGEGMAPRRWLAS